MKSIYKIILIALVFSSGLLSSCYDDSSTLDVEDIPGLYVNTNGVDQLYVYQYEHLQISLDITSAGIPEEDIEFKWKINLAPNDTVFTVIGTEKDLDYEILLKPNEAGRYYQLVFIAKDMVHDLEYVTAWDLEVRNQIGEGLVVAEYYDDNTTDFSLIMSPEITADYDKVKILKDLYSTNSGQKITGRVKQVRFTNMYGSDILLAITDNSITQINRFDYSFGAMNDDLFFATKDSYSPQFLGSSVVNQFDVYVGNHQLTSTWLGISTKFGLPFDFTYEVPDYVAMQSKYNPNVVVNFYDESLGAFVYIPTFSSFGDHTMHSYPPATGAFDPSNVPNKENLAAGTNAQGDFLHLLKDKTTNNIELYVLDEGIYQYPSPIPPAPKSLFDLSSAPDIANAKHFVFLDNQSVMFYATDTKIYAMIFSASTPYFEERYTVSAGEEITTLQVYQQSGYYVGSSDDFIATNNKQLVMSTYGSEGKVYLLPFINLGSADIDVPNIKTFTGFNRISAITPQK